MPWSSFIKSILDAIYPQTCIACDDHMALDDGYFCLSCLSRIPYTYMEQEVDNAFEEHFWGRVQIEAGMALSYFVKDGVMQKALYAMKYQNQPTVGYMLGQVLGYRMKNHPIYSTCDCVVPVPLHSTKKRKRGYNQCDFIARGIASVLEIDVASSMLRRSRANTSQTRKSRIQRMKNVDRLFERSSTADHQYHHYLLIDDVMTSGATLDACAQALRSDHDCKISMATLAMGSKV